MIGNAEARAVIDDLFEEEALIIGGLVALHYRGRGHLAAHPESRRYPPEGATATGRRGPD